MSKRQQVTAVRLANVNEAEFEAELAGPEPPTLTELVRRLSPATTGFSNIRRLPDRYTIKREIGRLRRNLTANLPWL